MPGKNNKIKKYILSTPSFGFWKKHEELLDELLQDKTAQLIFMTGIAKNRPRRDVKSKTWYENQSEKVKRAAENSFLFDEDMVSEIDRIKKEQRAKRLYELFEEERIMKRNGEAVKVKDSESVLPGFQTMGNMLRNGGFWLNEAEEPEQKVWRRQALFDSRIYTKIVSSVTGNVTQREYLQSRSFRKLEKEIHFIPEQMKALEGKSEEAFRAGMKEISEDFSKAADKYIDEHKHDEVLTESTASVMDSIDRLKFIFNYVQTAEKLENYPEDYFVKFDKFLENRKKAKNAAEERTDSRAEERSASEEEVRAYNGAGTGDNDVDRELEELENEVTSENPLRQYELSKAVVRFSPSLYNCLIQSITFNLHDHYDKGYKDTDYPEYTDLVNTARELPQKIRSLYGSTANEFRQGMKEVSKDFEKKAAVFIRKHEGEGVFTENDQYLLENIGRLKFIFDYIQKTPALDGNSDAYSHEFDRFLDNREKLMKESPNTEHLKLLTDPKYVKEKTEEKTKEKEAREQKIREAKGLAFRLAAK